MLNEIGGALKPKITTVIHPANSGAGLPDGGFFSAKELRQHPDEVSLFKLNPEHGVLEVKPVDYDLGALPQTPQVRGYLEHYGQILLTNYRSFALHSWEGGKPVAGENFSLGESAPTFWDIARQPARSSAAAGAADGVSAPRAAQPRAPRRARAILRPTSPATRARLAPASKGRSRTRSPR